MKRYAQGLLVAAFGLALACPAMAFTGTYTAGAGINGTVHDLSRTDTGMAYTAIPADVLNGVALDRICIFCHTPHNSYRLSPLNDGPGAGVGGGPQAPDAFDYLPLWNHETTGNYASYTMYQNGPGAPQVGDKALQAVADAPGGTSLLCLSCHDGSIAVNSYGNASQPTESRSGGGNLMDDRYVIGKDQYLGNHHPIGFDYDAVQAGDAEIRNADVAQLGGAGSVRAHLYGAGNSRMECGSCHSVHNKGNSGERLLWRSDQRSRLCLSCHIKGDDPGVTTP